MSEYVGGIIPSTWPLAESPYEYDGGIIPSTWPLAEPRHTEGIKQDLLLRDVIHWSYLLNTVTDAERIRFIRETVSTRMKNPDYKRLWEDRAAQYERDKAEKVNDPNKSYYWDVLMKKTPTVSATKTLEVEKNEDAEALEKAEGNCEFAKLQHDSAILNARKTKAKLSAAKSAANKALEASNKQPEDTKLKAKVRNIASKVMSLEAEVVAADKLVAEALETYNKRKRVLNNYKPTAQTFTRKSTMTFSTGKTVDCSQHGLKRAASMALENTPKKPAVSGNSGLPRTLTCVTKPGRGHKAIQPSGLQREDSGDTIASRVVRVGDRN